MRTIVVLLLPLLAASCSWTWGATPQNVALQRSDLPTYLELRACPQSGDLSSLGASWKLLQSEGAIAGWLEAYADSEQTCVRYFQGSADPVIRASLASTFVVQFKDGHSAAVAWTPKALDATRLLHARGSLKGRPVDLPDNYVSDYASGEPDWYYIADWQKDDFGVIFFTQNLQQDDAIAAAIAINRRIR
jgi:hypothetical protein